MQIDKSTSEQVSFSQSVSISSSSQKRLSASTHFGKYVLFLIYIEKSVRVCDVYPSQLNRDTSYWA